MYLLYDLTSDNLKNVLANQNLFALRTLSKGIKDRIDRLPQTVIRLSAEGTSRASTSFFKSFHGSLIVGSRHGWSASTGWFRSYLDDLDLGLHPDQSLSVHVDEDNVRDLSEALSRIQQNCRCERFLRIRHLCLFFVGGVRDPENSFAVLAGLQEFVASIDLHLQITIRLPLTLQRIARNIASLPRCFSIVEVSTRCSSRPRKGAKSFAVL